jgi:hypothetical protein
LEVGEPHLSFLRAGAAQVQVLVVFDHGQESLTALQRLFSFDLAAEP